MKLFQYQKRSGMAGIILFVALLLFCVVGPFFSPHDPDAPLSPAENRYKPPSINHWFGTDKYGRDLFARVLVGGRLSLSVGLCVVIFSLLIGSLYGALSGYAGGLVDYILMRLLDVLLSFPLVFLATICLALFGGGLQYLIVILVLTSWMDIARLVRAEVLSLKNRPFALRAKASGFATLRLVIRHLLPNTFPTLIAVTVVRLADIVLIESSLSFIGLGVQPPMASWGAIINDGRMVFLPAWWVSVFPGLAIILTIFSLNLIGDGLKEWHKN